MGNRDWAQYIAEDLGYYVDFVSEAEIGTMWRTGLSST